MNKLKRLKKKTSKHLVSFNLIAKEHNGFLIKRSCLTDESETLDTVPNAIALDTHYNYYLNY